MNGPHPKELFAYLRGPFVRQRLCSALGEANQPLVTAFAADAKRRAAVEAAAEEKTVTVRSLVTE